MATEVRIDKWLWSARIFKTRSIAAEACKKGHISVGGNRLKPSRTVKAGDVIDVRKPPITWSFKVLQAIDHRVGPKLIPEILENVTSQEQLEFMEMSKAGGGFAGRTKGTGRPTKKNRRDIMDFTHEVIRPSGNIPLMFDFDMDPDTEDKEE
jgi:ribosome-associated heat shock protein Hsp15